LRERGGRVMKKEALKDENHLLTTASGSTNITRNFFTLFSISTRGLNECMIVCMSVRNGILFERGEDNMGNSNNSWTKK